MTETELRQIIQQVIAANPGATLCDAYKAVQDRLPPGMHEGLRDHQGWERLRGEIDGIWKREHTGSTSPA